MVHSHLFPATRHPTRDICFQIIPTRSATGHQINSTFFLFCIFKILFNFLFFFCSLFQYMRFLITSPDLICALNIVLIISFSSRGFYQIFAIFKICELPSIPLLVYHHGIIYLFIYLFIYSFIILPLIDQNILYLIIYLNEILYIIFFFFRKGFI